MGSKIKVLIFSLQYENHIKFNDFCYIVKWSLGTLLCWELFNYTKSVVRAPHGLGGLRHDHKQNKQIS